MSRGTRPPEKKLIIVLLDDTTPQQPAIKKPAVFFADPVLYAPAPTSAMRPPPTTEKPLFVPAKPVVPAKIVVKPLTQENLRHLPTVKACEPRTDVLKMSLLEELVEHAKWLSVHAFTSSSKRDEEVKDRPSPTDKGSERRQFLQAQPQSRFLKKLKNRRIAASTTSTPAKDGAKHPDETLETSIGRVEWG